MTEIWQVANGLELAPPVESIQFWSALRQREYERLQAREERRRLAKALGYKPSRRA